MSGPSGTVPAAAAPHSAVPSPPCPTLTLLTSLRLCSLQYSPDENGRFDGQRGYGYISLEKFIDACREVNAGNTKASAYDGFGLPTIANTVLTTAILEAGRRSLDEKRAILIKDEGQGKWVLE